MRIINVLQSLASGGAEIFILRLVCAQKKMHPDWTFEVVSMHSKSLANKTLVDFAEKNQIDVIYLDKKPGMDFSMYIKLFKEIKRFKPDVVHTNQNSIVYSLLSHCLPKIKFVHTIHSTAENELPGFSQKIMRLAYKILKITPVAISYEIKKGYLRHYGMNDDKVPVIINGVNCENYKKNQTSRENIVFINVARFSPQKNHQLMLNAFCEAKKAVDNTQLLLLGDGDTYFECVNLAKTLGIEDSVDFMGNVSNVADYLSESDVFLMSSDYEGVPLSVLEAMSSGLPIVSTKAGGVVDIVGDGVEGLLVTCGDEDGLAQAIVKIAKDSELRNRLSENALKSSDKYDISICAQKYIEQYQKK